MRVPFAKDKIETNEWVYSEVSLFYPHEVLEYLFDTCGLSIPQHVLKNYWQNYTNLQLPGSPPHDDKLRVPLKLFGDDAQFNQQGDKLLGFIISIPLWRPRAARNSRFVTAAIPIDLSVGYPTLQPILSRIVWSLNQAFEQELPKTKWSFQVTEVGGDWKYIREAFFMRTHWNSNEHFCHFCKIPRCRFPRLEEPLPERNMLDFVMNVLKPPSSPLILLKRFEPGSIQWCLLHNLHLGLLWTANGGALAMLLEMQVFGGPDVDLRFRLRRAYSHFKAWMKEVGARSSQKCFTLKMLYKAQHGAYLSCKGWNSRLIAAWLAEACKTTLASQANDPPVELLLTTHAMMLVSATCSL